MISTKKMETARAIMQNADYLDIKMIAITLPYSVIERWVKVLAKICENRELHYIEQLKNGGIEKCQNQTTAILRVISQPMSKNLSKNCVKIED